jgi:uncharacterized protein YerC
MNDLNKSRGSLIKEFKVLRKQVKELEKEKRIRTEIVQDKARIEHSLGERVKELNCLYGLSELIELQGNSVDNILQGVADIIPASWQYPEITHARVIFEDREYLTANFRKSRWKQTADIRLSGRKIGKVEVYYLKKMPVIDEGPFLREERLLIEAIAERIGRAVERINVKEQLAVEQAALKNTNIALREVLVKVQDEKREIANALLANANKILMPILHALEIDALPKQKKYLTLIKNNLEEITSPFVRELSREFLSLTPVEIQICYMIKNGLSSKEIAQVRGISTATINRHREHIRKKLGIANKDVNLITFLNNYMPESSANI